MIVLDHVNVEVTVLIFAYNFGLHNPPLPTVKIFSHGQDKKKNNRIDACTAHNNILDLFKILNNHIFTISAFHNSAKKVKKFPLCISV